MPPLLLSVHRKKGKEKRAESLAYEGFPRANPPLSPNPFSKLLKFWVSLGPIFAYPWGCLRHWSHNHSKLPTGSQKKKKLKQQRLERYVYGSLACPQPLTANSRQFPFICTDLRQFAFPCWITFSSWNSWGFLGFPLFSWRSQYFQHILPESVKNTTIAKKREENPEILTNLVRKRLTRQFPFICTDLRQLAFCCVYLPPVRCSFPRVCWWWFPNRNGGPSSVGERNSATPIFLNLTPCLPQFCLILTSFWPNFYLNLTSAQSAISNHGLETAVYRPLAFAIFWLICRLIWEIEGFHHFTTRKQFWCRVLWNQVSCLQA